MLKKTETPCIGICSTIYGDEVCRGCKRFYQEIIDWNGFSDKSKIAILARLDEQISQIMQCFVTITDATKLKAKLDKHRVRYHLDHSPYTWAYHLLREGADKLSQIEKYGINCHPLHQTKTLTQLFHEIDEALYQLAETSYLQHS